MTSKVQFLHFKCVFKRRGRRKKSLNEWKQYKCVQNKNKKTKIIINVLFLILNTLSKFSFKSYKMLCILFYKWVFIFIFIFFSRFCFMSIRVNIYLLELQHDIFVYAFETRINRKWDFFLIVSFLFYYTVYQKISVSREGNKTKCNLL